MIACPGRSTSRRETTLVRAEYLAQLPLAAQLGRRAWVHRALQLRVVERRIRRR